MKRYFALILLKLTLCLSISAAWAQGVGSGIRHPYVNPTPGEISIVASTPIPDGCRPSKSAFQDILDCGFNLVMDAQDINYFKNVFKILGNLKLKYLANNIVLYGERAGEMVEELSHDPHLAGWKFSDEPGYKDLDKLSKDYERLYRLDPNLLIYINLIGTQAEGCTGPTKNYREYLQLIEKKFSPQLWSYDMYPFFIKKNGLYVAYDLFYSDLEMYSEIAAKTGKPFWAYCQSMAFKSGSVIRPAAKEEYLRFEAFSALAYGAQGIVYWTYGQRKSSTHEKYESALVNMDGKKTPAWYAAQKVNKDIIRYNDIFLNCKLKEVRHTGKTLYKDTKRLSGSFGPFNSIKSDDAGVLVSHITNKGNDYIVIVSHDVEKRQRVILNYKKDYILTDLTSENGKTYKGGGNLTLNLAKGGVGIFRFKKQ